MEKQIEIEISMSNSHVCAGHGETEEVSLVAWRRMEGMEKEGKGRHR